MSTDRSRSQLLFESIFTIGSNRPFQQIRKDVYQNTAISQQQAHALHLCLRSEACDLYFKALVSFSEAYTRLSHQSYTWPTIELYYSVFYATKAFLCVYDFALLRAERRLFYIKAQPNEKFTKCNSTTDHKAVFEIHNKIFPNDYLLSNHIDGKSAYDWLMDKREDVNYRDRVFREPEAPEFWETIEQELSLGTIEQIVDKLATDVQGLYCFQPDYAVLSIPIKRIENTVNAMRNVGICNVLTQAQQDYLNQIMDGFPSSIKIKFLL